MQTTQQQTFWLADVNGDGIDDGILITGFKDTAWNISRIDGYQEPEFLFEGVLVQYGSDGFVPTATTTANDGIRFDPLWANFTPTTGLDAATDLNSDGVPDFIFESEDRYVPAYYATEWEAIRQLDFYVSQGNGQEPTLLYSVNSFLGRWVDDDGFYSRDIIKTDTADLEDLDGDGISDLILLTDHSHYRLINFEGDYEDDSYHSETLKEYGGGYLIFTGDGEGSDLQYTGAYKEILRDLGDSSYINLVNTDVDGLDANDVLATLKKLDGFGEDGFIDSLKAYSWFTSETGPTGLVRLSIDVKAMDSQINSEIATPTSTAHFATAMIGTYKNDGNGLKESGAVHLGNGIYLTDSSKMIEEDGTGLTGEVTVIHGHGTDAEQSAVTVAEKASGSEARDIDLRGSDEIAIVKTGDDSGGKVGLVIYSNRNEIKGDFKVVGYSRSEDGAHMREYDITISEGARQDVTLKNRDTANDVLVTDGLPIQTDMLGGFQGSGVFQEIDGQQYLAGVLVGPWKSGTDQAFVVDPISDNYHELAKRMLMEGDADDYATNLLIGSERGGAIRGTGLNEILKGGNRGDKIIAGAGDDRLIDGGWSDSLYGGKGADVFVFVKDGSLDVAGDFNMAEDKIDLSDYGITFDDLVFRNLSAGKVQVNIGKERLIIHDGDGTKDFTADDFTEDMFIF